MSNFDGLYTPRLRQRISRALAHQQIGLHSAGARLSEPLEVLFGESEESVTCFYALRNGAPKEIQIIAVMYVASPKKRRQLWAEIAVARQAPQPGVLAHLPVSGNLPGDDFFIYNDGTWISDAFKTLRILAGGAWLSEPNRITSGRAGLSRLYNSSIDTSESTPPRVTG